jgi:hypothetical protein
MARSKSELLNLRLAPVQLRWLRNRAARDHDGNLSGAVRGAITDARLLELAREDYHRLSMEHGVRLPTNEGGETTVLQAILSGFMRGPIAWTDDGDEPSS